MAGIFARITRALFSPSAEPHAPIDGSPGQAGASATLEIDPRTIGRVTMSYSPTIDGDPDPGEVVWTWVPYQERDGRGKDRPVLVIAGEAGGTVLAVELTSQAHGDDPDYLFLGAGGWDSRARDSWVKLDRVFRLHQDGMRREAAALDEARFHAVRRALVTRYKWG